MAFYGQSTNTDYRRKWDQNEFEIKAKERIAAEREEYEAKKSGKILSKGIQPKREMLQARDYKVFLYYFNFNVAIFIPKTIKFIKFFYKLFFLIKEIRLNIYYKQTLLFFLFL